MKAIRKNQAGFTLMEMMLVVAIIGILSVAGTVGFGAMIERSKEKEGRMFLQYISDEVTTYLQFSPTFDADDFKVFSGYREDLQFYDAATGLSFSFDGAALTNGGTITLAGTDGAPSMQAVYVEASSSWNISRQ